MIIFISLNVNKGVDVLVSSDPGSPISWPLVCLYIVGIIVLVLLSAFFSLSETAFACMNKFRMKVKADDGDKKAKLVLKLYEKFDKTLIAVLVGNNIVAVLVSVISTVLFVTLLGHVGVDASVSSMIATIVMTIIVYLFGDTIPKFIAKAVPDKVALMNARPLYFFSIIIKPFSIIFEGLTWLLNKILKTKDKPSLTEEEFSNVVESIEDEGLLEKNESDIIQASLDFSDTSVKEVLTPVDKIYALDINKIDHETLNDILLSTEYSRIPFYDGSIDKIIGVLHVKTYLRNYLHNHNVDIKKSLGQPYFVTTKITMDELLDGFNKAHTHIAIVLSNNRVIGMVTMEDVLEELVGDINETNPNKNLNSKAKSKKGGKA